MTVSHLLRERAYLQAIAQRLRGKRVVVVGDMLVDEYVYGSTDRVSREAPVLILKFDQQEYLPGGAANAVNNVKALGGEPLAVGILGHDDAGRALRRYFSKRKIQTHGLLVERRLRTICKTRILGGGFHTTRQQLIRIDREHHAPIGRAMVRKLLGRLRDWLPRADAILFSDYGYGVVGETRRLVMRVARERKIPTVVDSRYSLAAFRGATVATPNEAEVASILGSSVENVVKAGRMLVRKLSLRSLVMTRGRLGMVVFEGRAQPAAFSIVGSDEVADVTGAGDTVASVMALGLAAGMRTVEAAALATYAASVVVMKQGTATVTHGELLEAIRTAHVPSSPLG